MLAFRFSLRKSLTDTLTEHPQEARFPGRWGRERPLGGSVDIRFKFRDVCSLALEASHQVLPFHAQLSAVGPLLFRPGREEIEAGVVDVHEFGGVNVQLSAGRDLLENGRQFRNIQKRRRSLDVQVSRRQGWFSAKSVWKIAPRGIFGKTVAMTIIILLIDVLYVNLLELLRFESLGCPK